MSRPRVERMAGYAVLCLAIVTAVAPLLLMLINALKTQREIVIDPLSLPLHPHWSNFTHAWAQCRLGLGLLNSVALCGATGYAEGELLEKWARDAKILDLFEGTQQIQLLIIARQLLGKSSSELR